MATPVRAGTSSSGKTTGSAGSLTIPHTATGDPLVVYCVVWQGNVTTLTYGGVALTLGGRQTSGNMRAEWWFLPTPAIGTANIVITIPATWVAAENHNVANTVTSASELAGLVWTQAQGSGTAPTIGIASRVGDLVIDIVGGFGSGTTFTPGAGQTKIHGFDSIGGTDVKTASSEKAGAPSAAVSWTLSVASDLSILAISFPDASVPTDTRVSQLNVELVRGGLGTTRVSQVNVELVRPNTFPPSAARVTQHIVELISLPAAPARVTQLAVEVLALPPAPARVTQLAVETLTTPSPPLRLTQLAVELLMPSPPSGENTSLWID